MGGLFFVQVWGAHWPAVHTYPNILLAAVGVENLAARARTPAPNTTRARKNRKHTPQNHNRTTTTTTTIAKFSSGVRERSLSRRKPRNFTGAWRLTATCACGRDWGYLNIDKSAKWQRTRQLMIVPSLSW